MMPQEPQDPQGLSAPPAVVQALQKAAPAACPDPQNSAALLFDPRWVEFARNVSHSRFLPPELRSTKDYDSTYDILMFQVTALSMGLNPVSSLFSKMLYIMPDARGGLSVAMWTSGKLALAAQHGCVVHSYYDAKTAVGVCEVQRGNAVFKATYTAQEAIIAGKMYIEDGRLYGYAKSAWEKYWPTMLIRRAQSRALEQAIPDVLLGLASAEEAREWQEVTPIPSPVPAPAVVPADIPVPSKISTED